tara:strand:+ start:57 stop:581 length:525 start_codon:yes stop_codon:yes gene_type:complete
VTPPLNLVLINTKKSDDLSELHRRWIARVAPICKAYDLHLTLSNFKIDDSPIEFAKKIAPSTSIGKGGEGFIELAQKGKVQITNLPLPQNIGTMVVCTSEPEEKKERNIDYISKLSNDEKIALIFGCDEHQNQMTKKIRKESRHHLDITGKRIKLSLDGEIGAVTSILSKTRKD